MKDKPTVTPHGLMESEFQEAFGTEEQCAQALFAWRWPDGFRCPACGRDRYCVLTYRNLLQCNACRRQTSLTAGTPLDATKMPLRLWFHGLYVLTETSRPATAMRISKALGISYNAAWRMKHRLRRVLAHANRPSPLAYRPTVTGPPS